MTRRRSLKRRIRARMKRTGESYTTARRHVTSRLEDQSRPAECTGGSQGLEGGARYGSLPSAWRWPVSSSASSRSPGSAAVMAWTDTERRSG